MKQFLQELRKANFTRGAEWMERGAISLDELPLGFHGNELAGEVGEACNIVKKIDRYQYSMPGSMDPNALGTLLMLGEELADALICIDLIAGKMSIDLEEHTRRKFNRTSTKHGFKTKL